MRRYIFKTLFVGLLAFGAALPVWPNEAFCLGCLWTGSCMGNFVCGKRCVCVKRDSIDVSGFCTPRY